jgi:hypothetical protein
MSASAAKHAWARLIKQVYAVGPLVYLRCPERVNKNETLLDRI